MNERYLFRGRRLDNGEWVEGYYSWDSTIAVNYGMDMGTGSAIWDEYEVDPSTVGQCTGLRDKNGTLIFEGDVVRYPIYGCSNCAHCDDVDECNPSIKIGVVGVCEVNMTNMIYDKRHELISSLYHNSAKCSEVIGTIHTTPELMLGRGNEDGRKAKGLPALWRRSAR